MVIYNTSLRWTRVLICQLAAAEDSRLLDRLKPVDAPSYYENRSCMRDTRRLILDHIVTWAEGPLEKNPSRRSAVKNIFWLCGSPGLGKTSVANSLCQRLHKIGKLGASFFCRRDDPVLSDPNRVLRTLLYRLAWLWSPYRDLVVQALRGDPNLNPDWTGCALLLERLYSLENHPKTTLVLVVDALDESGDPQTRTALLRCLSDICTRSNWLKLVVTSRQEHDITSFFQKLDLNGHDLSTDIQAEQDIRIFTKYRMSSLAEQYGLPSTWPGELRLEQIANAPVVYSYSWRRYTNSWTIQIQSPSSLRYSVELSEKRIPSSTSFTRLPSRQELGAIRKISACLCMPSSLSQHTARYPPTRWPR
jgi:hypothetical protein